MIKRLTTAVCFPASVSGESAHPCALEGTVVSLGTMYTGLDGLAGVKINKKDAHLKAYRMGESEDVQAQYPVEITAEGIMDVEEIKWTRLLNGKGGSTTIKDAKPMLDIAKDYQRRLRASDRDLYFT